jgi:hypothetical protein
LDGAAHKAVSGSTSLPQRYVTAQASHCPLLSPVLSDHIAKTLTGRRQSPCAAPDTVPVAGVVLIAGIDRFMSEARALTSLCSNAAACIVIALWEGACDRAVLKQELDNGYVADEPEVIAPEASKLAA